MSAACKRLDVYNRQTLARELLHANMFWLLAGARSSQFDGNSKYMAIASR